MSWISDLKSYLARTLGLDTSPTKIANTKTLYPTSECKFPLGDETSDKLTLPDGRKLGYAQYGSPTGKPIFYQHGLPGSRIEAARLHGLGQELGARIIATDRPGYGWSSPHLGRTLLGFPKDLERLADHLGINEYSVLVRNLKAISVEKYADGLRHRVYREAAHTYWLVRWHFLERNSNAPQ